MGFGSIRDRRAWPALVAAVASLLLAACGGGGDATQLLRETFTGSHSIKSGKVNFNLTLTPSGSKTITSPVSLTFAGPFQSLGNGKVPQSNFNIGISFQGHTGSLGIISTGTAGFVTLQSIAYRLPDATFRRLESSFAQAGGGGGGDALSKLGIDPLDFLTNPSVVGDEDVAGAATIHIKGTINVAAFLNDVNKALPKLAAQAGNRSLANGISSGTINRIAAAVQNPSFDVWTGKSDKTIRRLQINLTVPVTGQVSTLLGGLRSAAIGLSIEYDELNQPQTIATPSNPQPYSQFTTKLRGLVTQIRSSLSGLATGAGGAGSLTPGSTTPSTTPSGSATSGNVAAYSQCIRQAAGDVSKMQACAQLLNGH